jgi:hypothetical protein
MEAGDERRGDRVAVVLGERALRHAGKAEAGERRRRPLAPRAPRARPGPDRPGGGREDLGGPLGADAGGGERGVELEPVLDPLVVGVAGQLGPRRGPADAADGAVQRPLVGARALALGRAGLRAVEGDERWTVGGDPLDRGVDAREALGASDDLGAADRAAVEALLAAADVDADRDRRGAQLPPPAVRSSAITRSST